MKYRHCDGTLTVKASDNAKIVSFKTSSAADLKLADRLSVWVATTVTGVEKSPEGRATPELREKRKVRAATLGKLRSERKSTRVESLDGKTLGAIRHQQKVAAKRAKKWERRQDRKLMSAAKGASAGAGAAVAKPTKA